jgi:hypothetical protein
MTTQTISDGPASASLEAGPSLSPEAAKLISDERRRPATFADLVKKKRREAEVVIATVGDDNESLELVLRYRALSAKEFDDLVAKYPPSDKQKREGLNYNPDTLGPALVSAVCIDPLLTYDEAKQLIESPDWSAGEAATLTGEALRVCQTAAGVPFTVSG